MITQLAGTLVSRDLDHVEIMTPGGVGYRIAIPLGVLEGLPSPGEPVTLHTHLVVKEDEWLLFGFGGSFERRVFQRLLAAKGVGPGLALAMLSTLSAERVVRAIRERDLATLQSVPRMGRKKAEQLLLDLADKLDDLQRPDGTGTAAVTGAGVEDAVRGLVSLGYDGPEAERAVRRALEEGGHGLSAPELIRAALQRISS